MAVEKISSSSGLFTNYIYKALPLEFDESMSYYETLCVLTNYITNTVTPSVNTNADAFNELRSYVEHYFDDLDIQNEINEKLDLMVTDGTIERLLSEAYGDAWRDHSQLINRDAADQHPQSAITNLTTDLETIRGNISANATDITTKADSANVYTKTQTYSKSEADALLNAKANTSTTYSKTEVNNLLNDKASLTAVYTKTQADGLLNAKANAADVYTKTQTYSKSEVDNLITGVPSLNVYTKDEVNNLLNAKADKSTTYTKSETDAKINAIPEASADAKGLMSVTDFLKLAGISDYIVERGSQELDNPITGDNASSSHQWVEWKKYNSGIVEMEATLQITYTKTVDWKQVQQYSPYINITYPFTLLEPDKTRVVANANMNTTGADNPGAWLSASANDTHFQTATRTGYYIFVTAQARTTPYTLRADFHIVGKWK